MLNWVSGMVRFLLSRYSCDLNLFTCREHRALVRGNGLKSFLGRSQVSRALTLLTESGAFYCAIWVCIDELRNTSTFQVLTNGILDCCDGISIHRGLILREG